MKSIFKKLNQKGFAHHLIVPVMAVLVIAGIGGYVLTRGHAEELPTFDNTYINVDHTNVARTLDRQNPRITLMVKDRAGYTQGMLYDTGFTLTNKTATGYQLKYTSPTQGVGFYESSGGMSPGQVVKFHTYINPSEANGVYRGSATLQYYASDQQKWIDGPTINYAITLVNSVYSDYISVTPQTVNVTLNRADAATGSGQVLGSGFTVKNVSKKVTGFEVKYTQPTQGQGFYTSSAGLGIGNSATDQTYIATSKANGTYTGSAIVQYYDAVYGQWMDGPTVPYTIQLDNNPYTDYFTVQPLSINITLHKSDAQGGLVYGPGITIKNKTANSFLFRDAPGSLSQGQGLNTTSGGLQPGQTFTDQVYINASKVNGTYTGSQIFQYTIPGSSQSINGPTINYSITLTD